MYNMYLDRGDRDFIPVPPPSYCPPEPPPCPEEPHRPPPHSDGGRDSLLGLLKPLLDGIHMPRIELDDILLLTVAYLLLKESGDEELLLIIAALYFFGK